MQNLYRKKMPKRTFHQSVVDLLRLSPEQFDEFQTLAKQHLGEDTLHEGIPRPKNKILPSTWRTIADVDSPNTLAAMIHAERGAHNDHTNNFHEGGGLWEGAYSLFMVCGMRRELDHGSRSGSGMIMMRKKIAPPI